MIEITVLPLSKANVHHIECPFIIKKRIKINRQFIKITNLNTQCVT